MLDARKKIIILGSLLILFLLAFLFAILWVRKGSPSVPVVETPTSTVETEEEVIITPAPLQVKDVPPPPPPANAEEREKIYVRQLARTFVERLETSSNQNKNRNVNDVLPLATETMASYIRTKMQEQSDQYQGITTRVISMELTSFTLDTEATVIIGAQQEIQNTKTSETKYKNGRVDLKKISGEWKVSGLFWDP